MKKINSVLLLILLIMSTACNPSVEESAEGTLYSTPEAQGISSRAILDFVEAIERDQPDGVHSFILRRHGKIIAQGWWEPFNPDSPHTLYSLSKSFTSTAIGLTQDEGLLDILDPVISFFPGEIPEDTSWQLKEMRVRDLLRMNTGHERNTMGRIQGGDSWAKEFLALEVEHKPGTHFLYNTGASYMLSAIITKVTGKPMLEYLETKLFEPLGIETPTWDSDPQGINLGGFGLSVKTEDISKLGQLYLQKGMWKGEQLLSEAWVEEATSFQTSNGSNPDSDWDQGYGYQFWMCRHNCYRGDGLMGQFCIVMPEQDAVIAITSGTSDMGGIMNQVWDHLLAAMQYNALPPDEEGVKLLEEKLKELKISSVKGEKSSPLASALWGKTYIMEPNELGMESVSFDFEASPNRITITNQDGEQSFGAGYETMELGSMTNPLMATSKIAVSGAWETPDKYNANILYYETPHGVNFSFQFDEDKLLCNMDLKLPFRGRGSVKLEGKVK